MLTREQLPPKIPLMTLKETVLIPGGYLPFTCADNTDMALVDEALSNQRRIGIVQPNPLHADAGSSLFTVGCAGRIVNFNESIHGTYHISLVGCCRFDLVGEKKTDKNFLQGIIRWDRFLSDLGAHKVSPERRLDGSRERIENILQPYFRSMQLDIDLEALKTLDHEKFIVTLAMICPFTPSERQALLEATDMEERSKSIMALIEMALIQNKDNSPYAKH